MSKGIENSISISDENMASQSNTNNINSKNKNITREDSEENNINSNEISEDIIADHFVIRDLWNENSYASKKTLAQGMLDLALLASNAAQLKFILTSEQTLQYYTLSLTLVILSIVLQVIQAVTCVVLGLIYDITKHDHRKGADLCNNISLIIIILILVINVVISAFDFRQPII